MDKREADFLEANWVRLQETLMDAPLFRGHLKQDKVLVDQDIAFLDAKINSGGSYAGLTELINILKKKTGGFQALLKAARETGQSGVVKILEEFKPEENANERKEAPAARQGPGTSGRANTNAISPDEVGAANDPEYQEVLDFIHSEKKLDVEIERPAPDAVSTTNIVAAEDSIVLPAGQRGLALILNIVEFQNEGSWGRRNGSEMDVEYMTELLMQLDYEIHPRKKTARESSKKTLQDMQKYIAEFKDRCNKTEPQSIFVFVGTHGFYNLQLATSDTESFPPTPKVKLDLFKNIVKEFSRKECPRLVGKPKIFLVQACQSFLPEERTESDELRNQYIDNALIYTAGMPGESVNRDIYKGSWFVYGFTYMMMKHAKDKSFQDIMDRVRKMLGMIKSEKGSEQVSMPFPFMSKKLYFSIDP